LEVQQTLSVFLAMFAFMTLWHGAISDAFGRRRVTMAALGLFALASVGCAGAQNIQQLWFFRALQGMTAGAGLVIGRAVVRELLHGAEAQKVMSQITMMFALAPAIAPILGGWLAHVFGWRSIFLFLVLLSTAQMAWAWHALPETLPRAKRRPLHPLYLLRAYRKVLSQPAFLATCGALALNSAGYVLYVVSAPVFLMTFLHLHRTQFYWLFVPAMVGMAGGSWLSSHLAGRLSPAGTVRLGYFIMAAAVAANCLLNYFVLPQLPWTVTPILPFVFGMSLAAPSITLMALDLFPGQYGLAASCQAFIQTSCAALNAALLAPLLWGGTLSLATGQLGVLVISAALLFGLRGVEKALGLAKA
jgi:DHA1 family bicyclomycin/chloramphenicol resistance-like MFS transporter